MGIVNTLSRKARVAVVPGLLVAGSATAIAVADTIVGDADSTTNTIAADVESGLTLASDQSKTARFGLLVDDNATDELDGCNTQGGNPVTLRVTSDKTWVTVSATGTAGSYGASADIVVNGCDPDDLAEPHRAEGHQHPADAEHDLDVEPVEVGIHKLLLFELLYLMVVIYLILNY